MRMSRKADEAITKLTHQLSESVRKVAGVIAKGRGAEFANEVDAKQAYMAMITEIAKDMKKAMDAAEQAT